MSSERGGFVFGTAHAGLVLTALAIFGGAWWYQVKELAGVEKQLEQAQVDRVNAISARNRAEDVTNARLTELERSLRGCK